MYHNFLLFLNQFQHSLLYICFVLDNKVKILYIVSDQMAEWIESRGSASGLVDSGFRSESSQTNGLKIGIHCFPT